MEYLESAYYHYELREAKSETKQGLKPETWLEFNRTFLREYEELQKEERKNETPSPIFIQLSGISQ